MEFTHEVAEGMHGAIVKAVKTSDTRAKGLPVIEPATRWGCRAKMGLLLQLEAAWGASRV